MSVDPTSKSTKSSGVLFSSSNHTNSHFQQVSKLFPKNEINECMIRLGLGSRERAVWDAINPKYSLLEKAVFFWSVHKSSSLQAAIRKDDKQQLVKYMPLILTITKYIYSGTDGVKGAKYNMTSLRKSNMSNNELNKYKQLSKGSILRRHEFTSSTLNTSLMLSWQGSTIIKYIIPKGNLSARDISGASQYPSEKEVLLLPYSPIELVDFKPYTLPSDVGKRALFLTRKEIYELKRCSLITFKVLNADVIDSCEVRGVFTLKMEEVDLFDYFIGYLAEFDVKTGSRSDNHAEDMKVDTAGNNEMLASERKLVSVMNELMTSLNIKYKFDNSVSARNTNTLQSMEFEFFNQFLHKSETMEFSGKYICDRFLNFIIVNYCKDTFSQKLIHKHKSKIMELILFCANSNLRLDWVNVDTDQKNNGNLSSNENTPNVDSSLVKRLQRGISQVVTDL